MKRKILSSLLAITMIIMIFAGCGKKESSVNSDITSDVKVEVQQGETEVKTEEKQSTEVIAEESTVNESSLGCRVETVVSHEASSDKLYIEEIVYDENNNLRAKYVYNQSGTLLDIFVYDESGNLIQNYIFDKESNYVYDSMGTYKELTYWSDEDKIYQRWEYDSYGNEVKYDYIKNDERTQGEFYNYEYDANGKVIKRYNNSEIVYYEYDEKGNLAKETICDSDEEVDNYYLYKCDEKGNVLERAFYEVYGNGDEFLEYTEVMTYDNNNDVDSLLKYYSEERYPDKAEAPFGFTCTYDYKPNVKKYDYLNEYSSNTSLELEYDESGRVISSLYTNGDTKHSYIYTYNSEGIVDLLTHEGIEDITWDYLDNGCDKNIILVNTASGSKQQEKKEFIYDEKGLLVKYGISLIHSDGEVVVIREHEFTYNADGIISSVTTTEGDDIEVLNFE